MAAGFRGDQKSTDSLLSRYDRRFAHWAVERMPARVQSHYLTLMTLAWSAMLLTTAWWAQRDLSWLWASSAIIAAQYLTDAIDGKLGRARGAGLVHWGFYMDHLLDYVFMCSIVLGYALVVPRDFQWLMAATVAVGGGFMVSEFLACALTGHLRISLFRLGPVEVRLILIGLNGWLAMGGRLAPEVALPLALIGLLAVLVVMIFQTQGRMWAADRVERTAGFTARAVLSSHGQPNLRMEPTRR